MVRFKNRYITVEVDPVKLPKNEPWPLKTSKLYRALMAEVENLHGDFGVASITSGLAVKYCNKETRIAVIRCRHGPHRFVATSIPFIHNVGKDDVSVNTLYTGATLHQCYKFIKAYQENHLQKLYSSLKTEEERQEFAKSVLTLPEARNICVRETPDENNV
ncbi:hypothetical protein LSTR_LSTR001373 [Laodelphax striatellus]|uniref:Ribonuclease P/MRP protein subunit POP5 n=1 Tax=Laodelphax striatellus TaxID=195883 RepID=A0A482XAT3_LAOST|nr:hypothetical protein LSTR_LSTR001373 [Laodelphax striatellus]